MVKGQNGQLILTVFFFIKIQNLRLILFTKGDVLVFEQVSVAVVFKYFSSFLVIFWNFMYIQSQATPTCVKILKVTLIYFEEE